MSEFLVDMTAGAGGFAPIVGRDEEITQLTEILLKRSKNNALLVGEPGVGKTAIVEEFARRAARDERYYEFKHTRLLQLDVCALVAGSAERGSIEERVKTLLRTITSTDAGDTILFIDEIHTLVGSDSAADQSRSLKLASNACVIDMLKGYMERPSDRGGIQVLGATTFRDYAKYFKRDAAFNRRFRVLTVREPTRDEAARMVHAMRVEYERFHRCRITTDAIDAAVRWSDRYLSDRAFPDKTFDVIDDACSKVVMEAFRNESACRVVDVTDVAHATALIARMDVNAMLNDVASATTVVRAFARHLRRRVVGQGAAHERVIAAMARRIGGLSNPSRPLCSMLFVGPTGVGKTETARIMGECFFGDADALLRLDMSEFMTAESVSALVGPPPGYVGFEEGGRLTNAIRRAPSSVVLLDEIEKAHPSVWRLLLQILEDGRLSDGTGRRCDFSKAIVVMTANATCEDVFPPELKGRVDETVRFEPLGDDALRTIVNKEIAQAIRRSPIRVLVSPETRCLLHDECKGTSARKVRELVEKRVLDRVAVLSLEAGDASGDESGDASGDASVIVV